MFTRSIACWVLSFVAVAAHATTVDYVELQKLTAGPNAQDSAGFGRAAATEGNIAVIGAPAEDILPGTTQGAAYIFEFDGTAWNLRQRITADFPTLGANFGTSLSISNGKILVGAPFALGNAANSGAAYLFELNGGTWVQSHKFIGSNTNSGDQFGTSVSISGDTVFVGAPFAAGAGFNRGSAYAYRRNLAGVWNAGQEILPNFPDDGHTFGLAVAVGSANTALVGEPGANNIGGLVWLVEFDGFTWSTDVDRSFNAFNFEPNSNFGASLAFDGAFAAIGAPLYGTAGVFPGAAFVFEYFPGRMVEVQELAPSISNDADQFGFRVGIYGNSAVATAPLQNAGTGAAFFFDRSPLGIWDETQAVTGSDTVAGDRFGASAAISSSNVLIGANLADNGGNSQGAAYLFGDAIPPTPTPTPNPTPTPAPVNMPPVLTFQGKKQIRTDAKKVTLRGAVTDDTQVKSIRVRYRKFNKAGKGKNTTKRVKFQANGNWKFKLPLANQKKRTKLTFTATDTLGLTSKPLKIKVTKIR